MTQAEFAQTLSCHQATVSQYEKGKIGLSASALARLAQLATPAEKEVLEQDLRGHIANLILERNPSIDAAFLSEFLDDMFSAEDLMSRLPERLQKPEVFNFIAAVSKVLNRSTHIHSSVTNILETWAEYGSDPEAAPHFQEALEFLMFRLMSSRGIPRPSWLADAKE